MRSSSTRVVRVPERVAHVLAFAASELPHELLRAVGPEAETRSLVEALAEYDIPEELAREAARVCVNLASVWDDVASDLSESLGTEVQVISIESATTEGAPDGSFYASGSVKLITEEGERSGTFSLEIRHEPADGFRRISVSLEVTVST